MHTTHLLLSFLFALPSPTACLCQVYIRFCGLVSVLCSASISPRKKLKVGIVTKDENKAPPVDPKLTAKKINKKNYKGAYRRMCSSVFTDCV